MTSPHLLFSVVMLAELVRLCPGQFDVTSMVTNEITNETVCYCPCEDLELAANRSASAPSTDEEAALAGQLLQDQLKVDKANLSASTRKKNSAPDDRPSAQGIGAVGVAVLVSVVASIVILDLSTLIADVRMAVRRLWVSDDGPRHRCTASRDSGDGGGHDGGFGDGPKNPAPAPYAVSQPGAMLDLQEPDEGIGEDLDDVDDRRVLTKVGGQGPAARQPNVPDIRTRRELLEMRSLPL